MYNYVESIATKIILVNISEKIPMCNFVMLYLCKMRSIFFDKLNKCMQPCVLNPEETEIAALDYQAYSQVK